jgi:hypothetical protein
MTGPNHCGTCNLCCKLLEIPVLEKPAEEWCTHCDRSRGCTIYEARPAPCRDFVCLWLGSQTTPKPLPAALRPDRAGILFYYVKNFRELNGVTDPGRTGAWNAPVVQALLKAVSRTGRTIIFRDGRNHYAVDNGRVRPIRLSAPNEKGARTFAGFLD